jgi:hypothetical protein
VLESIRLTEVIEKLKLVWEPVWAIARPRRNQTPSAMELSSIFGTKITWRSVDGKLEVQVRGAQCRDTASLKSRRSLKSIK